MVPMNTWPRTLTANVEEASMANVAAYIAKKRGRFRGGWSIRRSRPLTVEPWRRSQVHTRVVVRARTAAASRSPAICAAPVRVEDHLKASEK